MEGRSPGDLFGKTGILATRALNIEIMLRLQERGPAVPSDTTVQGRYGLRCAFNNHRTRREDIDGFLADVLRVAEEIGSERAA